MISDKKHETTSVPEQDAKPLPSLSSSKYNQTDLEFMSSLNAALLAGSSSRINILLYIICLVILSGITWAYFAELDERTRGAGRVIPSRQIQVVQNLEGGIIEEIHVFEGQAVEKGEVLVTIDDTGIGSSYAESISKIRELESKASRLQTEAGITKKMEPASEAMADDTLFLSEQRLYASQLRQHENRKNVLNQQLKQRKIDLSSASQELSAFRQSQKMINREIELSKPLLKKQLLSELEFLQLEQRALEKKQEVDTTKKRIEKLRAGIVEMEQKINELEESRQAEAMEELNAVTAEMDRIRLMQIAIKDRVTRTSVKSPVDGTVKQLLINTIGGVLRPGMEILEIVPDDESLLIETKIKPSDIAFIFPGQKAVLKFTAYDFAIYGGLDGEVTHISADTITDDKGGEYYLVRIKTEENFLGTEENKKKIIVGMTAQVDIITGKKTVMQYLMKPILRARDNALRER